MAAACRSLQHIFEGGSQTIPENPTFIESLSLTTSSWKNNPSSTVPSLSFTEIFGELHFKESSPSSPQPILPLSPIDDDRIGRYKKSDSFSSLDSFLKTGRHKNSDSFSSMNSESLQLCTEGLGFESCDDVEDPNLLATDIDINDWKRQQHHPENKQGDISSTTTSTTTSTTYCIGNMCSRSTSSRSSRRTSSSHALGAFPPPISCIGKSGKPWVNFKSYRHDGRFVLKEVRIPTQEFLHASRENGRLKLHFVQPDYQLLEEEDYEVDEDIDDDTEILCKED